MNKSYNILERKSKTAKRGPRGAQSGRTVSFNKVVRDVVIYIPSLKEYLLLGTKVLGTKIIEDN